MCALCEAVASTLQYVAEEIGGVTPCVSMRYMCRLRLSYLFRVLSSHKGNIFLNAKQ